MSLYSRIITAFTTPQSVSTPTVVMAFTQFEDTLENTLLCVVNLSGTEQLNVWFDTSEDGTAIDTERHDSKFVDVSGQASLLVGPQELRTYWRIVVSTVSGSAATVKWQVKRGRLGGNSFR